MTKRRIFDQSDKTYPIMSLLWKTMTGTCHFSGLFCNDEKIH